MLRVIQITGSKYLTSKALLFIGKALKDAKLKVVAEEIMHHGKLRQVNK